MNWPAGTSWDGMWSLMWPSFSSGFFMWVSGFQRAVREGKPQGTGVFHISAWATFTVVPPTRVSWPSSESLWERTLQRQGYSEGNHCCRFCKQSAQTLNKLVYFFKRLYLFGKESMHTKWGEVGRERGKSPSREPKSREPWGRGWIPWPWVDDLSQNKELAA